MLVMWVVTPCEYIGTLRSEVPEKLIASIFGADGQYRELHNSENL